MKKNDNPHAPKKYCAIAVWLSPGTVINVPFETVAMEAAKTMIKMGAKTATRARALINDVWDFINECAGSGKQYWELIYVGVSSEYLSQREYWEKDLIWRILVQADKFGQPSYCFTTDTNKIKLLSEWGFVIKKEGLLVKKVKIWGLIREPLL